MNQPKNIYYSHWTADRIKEFRMKYLLSQAKLARLLEIPQQRVSEWECGIHGMKRLSSKFMDQLEQKIRPIRNAAGRDHEKYKQLLIREFGISAEAPGA